MCAHPRCSWMQGGSPACLIGTEEPEQAVRWGSRPRGKSPGVFMQQRLYI